MQSHMDNPFHFDHNIQQETYTNSLIIQFSATKFKIKVNCISQSNALGDIKRCVMYGIISLINMLLLYILRYPRVQSSSSLFVVYKIEQQQSLTLYTFFFFLRLFTDILDIMQIINVFFVFCLSLFLSVQFNSI